MKTIPYIALMADKRKIRKAKTIMLPFDKEFKNDLKRQAIELDYTSPSNMIEQRTLEELEKWRDNKRN